MTLTALQKQVLARVIVATEAGQWYRATAHGGRTTNNGERVTLASLHTRGLCVRQARRGIEGECNTAYEYQASARVLQALRELRAERAAGAPGRPQDEPAADSQGGSSQPPSGPSGGRS